MCVKGFTTGFFAATNPNGGKNRQKELQEGQHGPGPVIPFGVTGPAERFPEEN